eukprot:3315659-Rhodomonas_salina.2
MPVPVFKLFVRSFHARTRSALAAGAVTPSAALDSIMMGGGEAVGRSQTLLDARRCQCNLPHHDHTCSLH